MIRRIFLFLILAVAGSGLYAAQKEVVINVPCPEDGPSNAAFRSALDEARTYKGRNVVLQLQMGTYFFDRSTCDTQVYFVSNTASEKENPDPAKHIGIWMKDMEHLTIDGGGARLVMTGLMTALVMDNCHDITIRNLSIDYARPTQTEMEVVEDGEKYMIARVHPTSNYRIDNGKLIWYGDGWEFSEGIAQTCDRIQDITWRSWSPMKGLKSACELDKNLLLLRYDQKPGLQKGWVFQMRDGIRYEVASLVHQSSDIRFEQVNYYYLGNFGVVCQTSENVSFHSVNFEPETGSGRTNAGFADFIQVSGCKGKVDIAHCRFVGAHDDPINIHGTYLKVTGFVGDRQIKVRYMHHQTYGFDSYFPKDEIEFVNEETLMPEYFNTVKSSERLSDREFLLTLARPMTQDQMNRQDWVIENATWTPEVSIRYNYFSRIPTRGILISTRKKVEITNNFFHKMRMSAILMGGEARRWFESGRVDNILVANNHFIECGSPVIRIIPENVKHVAAVHKNIVIRNNYFKMKHQSLMTVKSAANLLFKENVIDVRQPVALEQLIHEDHAEDVRLEDNKIQLIR